MGLLYLAVLGPPEVFHDGSRLTFSLRKAQALLIYLAVEGGMHSRSKLAALLWPDSEPHDARTALRNAIALLRGLLADADIAAQHSHLLSERELLGLDPHTPLELDLDVVQQAYKQTQGLSTVPAEQQRAVLVAHLQRALALVRGPFLDGFWLGEDSPFDEWIQQQQHRWQVRLQLLFDQLSSWQEAAGELEQVRDTLTRWLALDPLQEEAYRRLMRVHLALGDPSAALQVYTTCRARLAAELQIEPSADTVALAEHIRATEARRSGSQPARPVTAESWPSSELAAPLVGRATAFTQLVGRFQQAWQGQPQAVLVVGEAGIGKTRLATEFVAWAQAQGAEVLSGQAFETGGRLPYQPLVDAFRPRLEEENAPEDLLDDLWLAELARLLPELRVRYPDLPTPTQDELAAKVRLFEAVARLVDALSQRAPLVLLLDDLHRVDGASLDLVRYLARYWKSHGSRVLLLATLRSEWLELNPARVAELADLGRDLPVTHVTLQTLSEAETLQLVQAIAGEGERRTHGTARSSSAGTSPAQEVETPLVGLGHWLFAHTGGQPFYLLETLKMLRDRQWLVPRLSMDGTWRLELDVDMALAQKQSWRELLPPSVRAMILARLAQLSPAARQLVMAGSVLGTWANAQRLWQVAEMEVQAGVEALEEAVGSGILREEQAGASHPGSYRFAHELMREVVYTELGEARRLVLHQRALALLQDEGAKVCELAYHALAAGETEAAYGYSVQAGDETMAVFAVEDAIVHYERARSLLQEHQRLQAELPASEVEHLYAYLGRAYTFLNAWEQAQQAYEELLTYAQHRRQLGLVSMTLNRLAILVVQQSHDKPQVRALLEEAWRMAETSHERRALAETEWNLAQITACMWDDPKSALSHGQHALELARESLDKELEARSLSSLGFIHLLAGDFQEAIHALEASLALYAALGNEPTASRELSLASFKLGAPPTQHLSNRASEAMCWGLLALAQVHAGQVHNSIRSGRIALSLSKEIKNVWVQVFSTFFLTHGLLEAGAYEEALALTQQAMALARTFPPTTNVECILIALGSVYHALQQWEEAHTTLAEAEAVAEALDLGPLCVPVLSRLCMHYALAGQWEQAYSYAVKAIALRKSIDAELIPLDFYRHYETEALLRGGDERQARAEVHRLGKRLGPYRRFRIPYLRSLALLAAWDGHTEQAINHLREAAQLAADIRLPGERWQIQAALGSLYEAGDEPAQARTAFGEATSIIQELAQGIGDEALRRNFLAACGEGSNSTGGSKQYTIGFSLSTLTNPFFVGMHRGIRDKASKLKVHLIDDNANGDAAAQVSQIEDLITQGVDLLIINPVSADGIVPVLQQANSANVPVISVDRSSSGGTLVSFVQTDGVAMGKEAVSWIAQQLTQRYGSAKGMIVDLQGLRGTTPAEDREKGFQEALQNYPNIKVVASQAANFDQEKAYNVTADILQANPHIDAIFCANDDMAIGAIKAIQAANRFYLIGKPKHIAVIGIDGSAQALQALRAGTLDATILQNPPKEAEQALDLAVQYLDGKPVTANEVVPTMLITGTNIDSQAVKAYGLWGEEH